MWLVNVSASISLQWMSMCFRKVRCYFLSVTNTLLLTISFHKFFLVMVLYFCNNTCAKYTKVRLCTVAQDKKTRNCSLGQKWLVLVRHSTCIQSLVKIEAFWPSGWAIYSAKMHAIFVKENKFDNEVLFKISSEDTQGYIFVKRALNNLTTPFVMNCYADVIVCQFLQGSHSFEQAFICLLAITGCIMQYSSTVLKHAAILYGKIHD